MFSQICNPKVPGFEIPPEETLCDQHGESPDWVIGEGTPITHSSQLFNGVLPTQEIYVIGDFTINSDFTFPGTILKFADGVSLIVKNKLTLDGAKLFACDCLWNGIVMEDGSQIVSKNNTQIEDATAAIQAINKYHVFLEVENTTFNRNVIGIQLENEFSNPHGPIFFKFETNFFTTTAPINCSTDEYGKVGVKLKNVFMPIHGSTISTYNFFRNLINGVVAEGQTSLLKANHWFFEDILRDGIYLENGSLDLFTFNFTNCERNGIYVDKAQTINVRNSIVNWQPGMEPFSDYRNGIFISNFSFGSQVNILGFTADASLENTDNAIRGIALGAGDVNGGTRIVISDNSVFSIAAGEAIGIHLDGNFPNSIDGVGIFNNSFKITSSISNSRGAGIKAENGDKNKLNIYGNSFSGKLPFGGNQYGISLIGNQSGKGNIINENSFNPAFGKIVLSIYSQDFRGSTICSNTVNGDHTTHAGIQFRGDNNDTNFSSNTLIGGTGTLSITQGFIGTQPHKGNKWYEKPSTGPLGGPWTPPGEVFASTSNTPYPPDFSKFTVHTNQSIRNSTGIGWDFFSEYYPWDVDPNTSDFFEIKPNGTPQFCNPQEPEPTIIDEHVATDQFAQLSLSPATNWEAKRYLYQKIKNAYIGIYTEPIYTSFIAEHENSAIGKFYIVDQKIKESFETSTLNLIEDLTNDLDSVLEDLEANDILLQDSSEPSEIELYRQTKIELMVDLQLIQDSIININEVYNTNKITILSEAFALNNQIVSNTNFEVNEKKVNEIYLQSIISQNGELTEAQINELSIIAQECPEEAGWAVYSAIGLIPTCWRRSLDLCDYEIELPQARTAQFNQQKALSKKSIVYPNPAASELTLLFESDLTGDITFHDLTGRIVYQANDVLSGKKIDVTPLQSGIYFLKANLSDGAILSEKFIIK